MIKLVANPQGTDIIAGNKVFVDKINEIIDVLNQQGEASKYKVVSFEPIGETVPDQQGEGPEYKTVGYLKYNPSGEVKRKRVSIQEIAPPEQEEIPKDEGGDTWSIWEGFDDRAGTLTRNFGKVGRPANIQDLQEVFISKEKIKREAQRILRENFFSLTQQEALKELVQSLEIDL
jgi:hypothetical protein